MCDTFEQAVVDLCRAEKSASIALSEVCSIALGVVKLVQTEDEKVPEISKLLFNRKLTQEPLVAPNNLDEPFIELPASMKVDAKALSAWQELNEVFTDTEESESRPEIVGDALFSVESVLRKPQHQ